MNKKKDDGNDSFSIKNILFEGNNNDLTCLIGRFVIYIIIIYFLGLFFYYMLSEDTIPLKEKK
jgi:hypothetical protein